MPYGGVKRTYFTSQYERVDRHAKGIFAELAGRRKKAVSG